MAQGFDNDFSEAATNAFTEDQIHIEATINDLNRDALEHSASLNWQTVIDELSKYFNNSNNWQRNFTLPVHSLMVDRIRQLNKLLNKSSLLEIDNKQQPAEILDQAWFGEYLKTLAQPINATTEKRIQEVIEQGQQEGWTVPKMQKNIKLVFQQWETGDLESEAFEWLTGRIPSFRNELITKVEIARAINTISVRVYGIMGVTEHEWLTQEDTRVREAHQRANGQVVAVGSPFLVMGESLLYPGDPAGSPENIIDCRCVTMPVI